MSTPRKNPLKAIKQAVANLLPGGNDEAQLTQAETEQAAALDTMTAKIAQLDSRRAAFLQDFAALKLPAARESADRLAAEIEEAERQRVQIDQALAEVRAKLAALASEKQNQAALDRVRSLARLRNEYDRSAQNVQTRAEDFAGALHQHRQVGRSFADQLENIQPIEARRLLHASAIDARAKNGLFRLFCLNPPAGDAPFDPDQWRWLRWPVNHMSAEARRTFLELERDALDQLAGFFATRQEAERARDRIDPTGGRLHVVRDDTAMVFRLVPYQLAGDYTPPPAPDSRP
jgi:DNA repair exonuclease SbcCD ATPase subunit